MPFRTTLYIHGRTSKADRSKGGGRRNWDVEIDAILPSEEVSPIFSSFHEVVDDLNPAGGTSAVVGSSELTYTKKRPRILNVQVRAEGRDTPSAAEALWVYLEEALSEFIVDED